MVVLHVPGRPRLVDEPRTEGLVRAQPLLQQLQRDNRAVRIPPRPVDDADRSFAEPSIDAVAPDGVPDARLGASNHDPEHTAGNRQGTVLR